MSAETLRWAFSQTLVPEEKLILIYLAWQADSGDVVRIFNMDECARFLGRHKTTVSRYLGTLQRRGFVDRVGRNIALRRK